MIRHDENACNACGVCADICPRNVFVHQVEGDEKQTTLSAERTDICIDCGHCVALCPHGAIEVPGIDAAMMAKLPPLTSDPDDLMAVLTHRRTIRRYKDEPVPRELLDRITAAARLAPTPTSRPVGIIVIEKEERLAELSRHVYALYEKFLGAAGSFFKRLVVKRRIGAQTLANMDRFVIPGLRWYLRWYQEGESDEVRRDSPAVILFHAPVDEPEGDASCFIATTYAVLMAECLGLGTCINGLIPQGCNRSEEARALLDLPANHQVFAALTLGYPRLRFKKSIPKTGGEVRYLD